MRARQCHDVSKPPLDTLYARSYLSQDLVCPRSAHARLVGDAFVDVLMKQHYLRGDLSTADWYWLPQCIALLTRYSRTEFDAAERQFGARPFSKLLGTLLQDAARRWNGRRYGLKPASNALPMTAQIAAVVTTYVTALQRYRLSSLDSHKKALEFVCNDAGACLNPNLVILFLGLDQELSNISDQFAEKRAIH